MVRRPAGKAPSRLTATFVALVALAGLTVCTSDRPNDPSRSRASTGSTPITPPDAEIAYTCIPDLKNSAGDICAAAVDGKKEYRLTEGPNDEIDPSWSPDGTRIVYRVNTDSGSDLFVVDVRTGVRHNLTNEETSGNYSPAWSPRGDRIAYAAFRPGDVTTGIYVIDVDGGEPTRLTPDSVWGEYPAWSPDGRRIVFSRNMTGNSSADFDIWVMNADGSTLAPLTIEPGADGEPAWSPDGTQIAFDRERKPGGCERGNSCAYDIWIMNADGSDKRRLTHWKGERSSQFPDWSPDGERLLFFYQDDRRPLRSRGVYTMRPNGSGVSRFPFGGGDWPDWRT